MKSFNNLYEPMLQLEEIQASIKAASKHKTHRVSVKKALANIEEESIKIQQMLLNNKFHPPVHPKESIREGPHRKARQIEKPTFRYEQIIHHMLMRQLRPIIEPRMYIHSYGSLPKKGALSATKIITAFRDEMGNKPFYVAELDIHKFYAHVDLYKLKDMLRKLIRDKRYLQLLFLVIGPNKYGLPLGYYPSPWLGHLYLMPMDNYILQELKPEKYIRYMDNLYLADTNKNELLRKVQFLEEFIFDYNLKFNPEGQIYRFEHYDPTSRNKAKTKGRAINCLGYVVHHNRVTMRKSILKRARTKANRTSKLNRGYRIVDASSLISRLGWFKHTDTHMYYHKYIESKVSIDACKRRVSAHARKENKNDQLDNITQCYRACTA